MLGEEAAKGIDELGALTHQQVARSEHRRTRLALLTLYGHEPHAWSLRRLADRLCIGGIVLLPLHEWLHVSGRNEPHLMAELHQLAAPVMRASTGLHRHGARWLRSEELNQLLTRDTPTEQHGTRRICAMRVKNLLCDIQADSANFFHGRLLSSGDSTPPLWHIDAVGGRPPHHPILPSDFAPSLPLGTNARRADRGSDKHPQSMRS